MAVRLYVIGTWLLFISGISAQELECNRKTTVSDYQKSFNNFTAAYIIMPVKLNMSCVEYSVVGNGSSSMVDISYTNFEDKKIRDLLAFTKLLPSGNMEVNFQSKPVRILNGSYQAYENGLYLGFTCNAPGSGQDIYVVFPKGSPNKDELLNQAEEVAKSFTDTPEKFRVDQSNCPPH